MNINASSSESSPRSQTWRGQWLGWLCLAILVFFTWLPYSYYLMVSWPWLAIWQLGFLLLGVWTIWMLRQSQLPFKPLGYGLDWVIVLIFISLLLSTIFAEFKQVSFWYVSQALCYGALLYIFRNWLGQGKFTIANLWAGIPIVGIITGIVGFISWSQRYRIDDPRNGWPFGQPNFLAGYILLMLPLTIFLALSHKGWQKILGIAASLLFGVVLYTTSSRGGFLGLFVLAIVSAGFFILHSQGKQRVRRLFMLTVALVIIVLIALSNPRVQQIIKLGTYTNDSPVIQVRVDGESQERLFMWQAGLNIFKAHPLLGIGSGNMSRLYDLYRPIEAGLAFTHAQELHNTPVQIVGELGLLGLSAYGLLIGCLGRLWYRLYKHLSGYRERYLLYGIGGGLLAYIFSSLTDYQLEHMSLSTTIILLIVMLIGLADSYLSSHQELSTSSLNPSTVRDFELTPSKIGGSGGQTIGNNIRRWLSLGCIATLVLIICIWLPVTRAMWLSSESERNFQAGNVTQAYEQASQAATIVPWDPTYNLLAAYQTLKIRENVKEPKLFGELTAVALQHFQGVVKAAPNDAPFNQVLGMLYRDSGNSQQATHYFSRAIELFPSSPLYTYYLLGREYLKQKQTNKAITALALEGLINPAFLTSILWETLPLSEVKEAVGQETINLASKLLGEISLNDPYYNQIYEQIVLLHWWFKQPLEKVEQERLRPIVQAILLIEKSPQSALDILNENINDSNNPPDLLLLRAWINPQQYLGDYLKSNTNQQENQLLQKSINRDRNFRVWLLSLMQNPKSFPKIALILTYRNEQGRDLAYIPAPPELETNLIVNRLNLFIPRPPIFPAIDILIDRVKTDKL